MKTYLPIMRVDILVNYNLYLVSDQIFFFVTDKNF